MSRRRQYNRADSDSSDSYLGSVSDLMAALTFVFILTVAVFALRLAETQERVDQIIMTIQESRERLVMEIQARLDKDEIKVYVDPDQGVLRILENGIYFVTAEESPAPGYQKNVGKLARVLAEVLPCYVQLNAPASRPATARPAYCDSSMPSPLTCTSEDSKVDTVLIEGHTDRQPFRGRTGGNLDLASRRAQEVFRMITVCEPSLETLFNSNDLRVVGVSGYGEHRPVSPSAADDENRRIDLRFMMELPDLQAGGRPGSGKIKNGIQQGMAQ